MSSRIVAQGAHHAPSSSSPRVPHAPAPNRRQFLSALGAGGALAGLPLPLFSSLPRAYAQAGEASEDNAPQRLILFYTPNGTKKELWRPDHEPGALSSLGPIMSALNPHLSQLTLLDGVDLKAALEGPGGPHQRGMASLFTGAVINEGDFVGGDGRKAGWGGGISLDQFIAQHIGDQTPFRSLELGVRVVENMPRGRICYAGSNQPLPPESDPARVYQRLFANIDEPDVLIARRLRRRRSALDSVLSDFRQLESKLDARDRAKLQQHAQSLRELERRIAISAGQGGLCQPQMPSVIDNVMSEADFSASARQQIDLMVAALACDQTRVASLQCSTAVNACRFTFLEPEVSHEGHSLSHAGDTNEGMQPEWERTLTWYAELFEYLLTRLAEIPEGEGTLLDNTVVIWGNEISRGNTHDLTNIPFVLAGSAGGALKTGQYLSYPDIAHNQLLLSIVQAFGIEATSFGAPHLNNGVLSELLRG